MPVWYLVTVAALGWSAACALTRWRRLGPFAHLPGLLAGGLPFLAVYLLVAATVAALALGGLTSAGGVAAAAAALAVLAGLAAVVRQSLLADAALHEPPARRPWRRILAAPLPGSRRDVVQVPGIAYGEGRYRTLDVYHRRDLPADAPVVLHLHGGAFRWGDKRREARPLIGHLAGRGMLCASADYRLQPSVAYEEQLADVLAAIAWVRTHAREYGGDPERIFLVGSSAGAYLAVDAVNAGAPGIAGVVGRYGYYGRLVPLRPFPPTLVIHGQNDILVPPSHARAFAERLRAGSPERTVYAELPGAQHSFDRFESIRADAVSRAVERFITTA